MSTEATKKPDNYFLDFVRKPFSSPVPTRTLVEKSAVFQQLGKEQAVLVEQSRVCSNLT